MIIKNPDSLSGLAMVYATKATFCVGARLNYKNKVHCVKPPCNAGLRLTSRQQPGFACDKQASQPNLTDLGCSYADGKQHREARRSTAGRMHRMCSLKRGKKKNKREKMKGKEWKGSARKGKERKGKDWSDTNLAVLSRSPPGGSSCRMKLGNTASGSKPATLGLGKAL